MVVLKFRVWDKELKAMFELKSLVFTLNLATIASKNDLFPSRTRSFDDIIFMQSTGLLDKNGKEIFEGDIVEWEHKDTGQLVRGIVKYDAELGFWGMTDVRFDDLRAIGYLANQRVTVLGNIYQNKELGDVELRRTYEK